MRHRPSHFFKGDFDCRTKLNASFRNWIPSGRSEVTCCDDGAVEVVAAAVAVMMAMVIVVVMVKVV